MICSLCVSAGQCYSFIWEEKPPGRPVRGSCWARRILAENWQRRFRTGKKRCQATETLESRRNSVCIRMRWNTERVFSWATGITIPLRYRCDSVSDMDSAIPALPIPILQSQRIRIKAIRLRLRWKTPVRLPEWRFHRFMSGIRRQRTFVPDGN